MVPALFHVRGRSRHSATKHRWLLTFPRSVAFLSPLTVLTTVSVVAVANLSMPECALAVTFFGGRFFKCHG
jgi:hypothetical protein